MSRYTSQPKTPAGRIAWTAFTRLIGAPPEEIFYGHGSDYGWIWVAEYKGDHAIYSASWKNAVWRVRKNITAAHCH